MLMDAANSNKGLWPNQHLHGLFPGNWKIATDAGPTDNDSVELTQSRAAVELDSDSINIEGL